MRAPSSALTLSWAKPIASCYLDLNHKLKKVMHQKTRPSTSSVVRKFMMRMLSTMHGRLIGESRKKNAKKHLINMLLLSLTKKALIQHHQKHRNGRCSGKNASDRLKSIFKNKLKRLKKTKKKSKRQMSKRLKRKNGNRLVVKWK